MAISNAQLAADIQAAMELFLLREQEFQAWMTGVANGGPNMDGTYPLTDATGFVLQAKSPDQLQWEFDQITDGINGVVAQTQLIADAVDACKLLVEADKAAAEAARNAALAAQTAAEAAQSGTASNVVDAQNAQNAAETAQAAAEVAQAAAEAAVVNIAGTVQFYDQNHTVTGDRTYSGAMVSNGGLTTESLLDINDQVDFTDATIVGFNPANIGVSGNWTFTGTVNLASAQLIGVEGQEGAFLFASRDADLPRSNDIVPTADGQIQFTGQEGTFYGVEIFLRVSTGAGGFRFNFGGDVATNISVSRADNANEVQDITAGNDFTSSATGENVMFKATGTIYCNSTGLVTLQWAQNTADVSSTSLRAGSWVRSQQLTAAGEAPPPPSTYAELLSALGPISRYDFSTFADGSNYSDLVAGGKVDLVQGTELTTGIDTPTGNGLAMNVGFYSQSGSSTYWQTPSPSFSANLTDPSRSDKGTIFFVFRPDPGYASSGNGDPWVFDIFDNFDDNSIYVQITTAGRLNVNMFHDGGDADDFGAVRAPTVANGGPNMFDGNWHSVVISKVKTYEVGDEMKDVYKLWIDGVNMTDDPNVGQYAGTNLDRNFWMHSPQWTANDYLSIGCRGNPASLSSIYSGDFDEWWYADGLVMDDTTAANLHSSLNI